MQKPIILRPRTPSGVLLRSAAKRSLSSAACTGSAVHQAGSNETYYVYTYRKVPSEVMACRPRRATTPARLSLGGSFVSGAIMVLIPIFWLEAL